MPEEKSKGILYLIPAPLSPGNPEKWVTSFNKDLICGLNHFIVEELKTARRFLKSIGYKGNFDNTVFHIVNEHFRQDEIEECLKSLSEGYDTGIISEAGMPCIADPGSLIVASAHRKGYKIIPLPGASSIFMALASSGFNGQCFVFHGYIPIEKHKRKAFIRNMESDVIKTGKSNIFIETPYRNNSLAENLFESCNNETMLCIAAGIGSDYECIKTMKIEDWRKSNMPLPKIPAVFILGQNSF